MLARRVRCILCVSTLFSLAVEPPHRPHLYSQHGGKASVRFQMESPLFVYGKRLSKMSSKLPAISMCLGGECNIQPRLNWGSLHIALEPDQRDTNAEHAQARRLCGHAFTWQNQNIYSTASFPPRRKLVEQGKGREGKGMEGKGREGEGIVHHLRWRKERHDLLRSLLQGAQASKPSLNDLQPAVMCQNHVNSVLQSSSFPMAFVHVFFFLLRRCLHARSGCCLRGGCCAHLVERAISGAQNACQHPPKLPGQLGEGALKLGFRLAQNHPESQNPVLGLPGERN